VGGGITRATSAKQLQLQRHPLLGRACTSGWLPRCYKEHLHRWRDRTQPCMMLKDILGRQQAGTSAALQRRLEQSQGHSGTCGPGCTVRRQGPALQPADKTQPLARDPPQVLLYRNDASSRACIDRICCPSLSSRAPTPAIALHLSRIHSPDSSSEPRPLGSGGSPNPRPPPPNQTLSSYPWQRLLCRV
jgi:hypothetical protein